MFRAALVRQISIFHGKLAVDPHHIDLVIDGADID
jgi:hypothetical protein